MGSFKLKPQGFYLQNAVLADIALSGFRPALFVPPFASLATKSELSFDTFRLT